MERAEAESFRILINNLIAEIEKNHPSLEESCKPIAPSSALGRLTRMDAITSRGVQQAVLSSSRKRLEALKNAIERLDKGTYGTCVRCGRNLSPERLKAVPEALICVSCTERRGR